MFPLRDTQPSYSKPVVTTLLIVINILVFLFQVSLDPYSRNEFIATYGFVPEHFSFQSVLTSMFLHGGWMHILGNMWFMWIFGNNVEDAMGRVRFVVFSLLTGVAAALTQVFITPASAVPMVGASGAISGVMGAYIVLYPRVRVFMLVPLGFLLTSFAWPAWMMLGYWLVLQFVSGLTVIDKEGGGVAFWAHFGGWRAGGWGLQLFS